MPFLPRLGLPEEDSLALEAAAPRRARRAARGGAAPASHRQLHRLHPARGGAGRGARLRRGAGRAGGRGAAGPARAPRTPSPISARSRLGASPPPSPAHRARGGLVLGVCGGYQMLGRAVADPHGVESGGEEAGLGLLPVRTTLGREKITRRVRARWRPDGPGFEGYEIHVGETAAEGHERPLLDVEGRPRAAPPPTGACGARTCTGSSSPAPPGATCWTGRAGRPSRERPRRPITARGARRPTIASRTRSPPRSIRSC